MSDIFISYARSTEPQAEVIAEALGALGYGVWRDDELPAHRDYSEVIEERLRAAKAVMVLWSADAVRSHWVCAEADVARIAGTLIQVRLDEALLPLPFNRIQCADLAGWSGEPNVPGWRMVVASLAELVGAASAPVSNANLPAPSVPMPIAARRSTIAPSAQTPISSPDEILPLPVKPSIAVLPFANLSNDPDQEYFADGMMDEIVTGLSRIRSIFVIASSSTMTFKGRPVSVRDAAHQLSVRYLLEGSVRKAGDRVRIAVNLVEGHTGTQIWAGRFEGTLDDVFALQDKVALSVAGVIEPALGAAESRRLANRRTDNMSSYDLYLRAAPLRASLRAPQVKQALDLLEQAIALDPGFGAALAQAAGCHSQIASNGWSDDVGGHRRRGLELAERAIVAEDDDAGVLAQIANALTELESDLSRPGALTARALELNPGCAMAWFIAGVVALARGDRGRAIECFENAGSLDPVSPLRERTRIHIAIARSMQERWEEALQIFHETTYRNARIYAFLVMVHGHLGQIREGREALACYEALSQVPIENFPRTICHRDDDIDRMLAGFAAIRTAPAAG